MDSLSTGIGCVSGSSSVTATSPVTANTYSHVLADETEVDYSGLLAT